MWTIAAANKKFNGPLGSYNGLTDIHLAHYFSSPAKLSHLKEAKLITADGVIVPEQKYKVESLKYEKKKNLYDFLARSMIQNAALKESSWNKKLFNYLEDISKMQTVENIKVDKKKLGKNASNCLKKMRATVAPIQLSKIHDYAKRMQNESNILKLPRSAHSSAQYALRNCTFHETNISTLKRCYSAKEASPYTVPLFWCNSDKSQVPACVHNAVKSLKRKKRKKVQSNLESEQKSLNSTCKISSNLKTAISDQCKVTLLYHGHGVLNSQSYFKKEIIIKQQHCGGTSVTVYKGDIAPNEIATFISLTHEGFPFSVTIFLDGIRDLKLSSCCVFRYTPRKRLGGINGNFSIEDIVGGRKCLKCQYLEIESSNNIRKKFATSENIKETIDDAVSFHEKDRNEEYGSAKENIPDIDNSLSEGEDSNISIKSETSTKYEEEIEENVSERFDLQNSESDAQIPEENTVESVGETNCDSESSIITIEESVRDEVKEQGIKATSSYHSENSSEDENGKEHVILVSVHGSPS